MIEGIDARLVQLGFVVRDIDQAMQVYATTLRAGPWFLIHRMQLSNFQFLGCRSELNVSVAMAYSGAIQVELIQQNNDGPSPFRRSDLEPITGLHHVALASEDYGSDYAKMLANGFDVVGEADVDTGNMGKAAYFDSGGRLPYLIELFEASGTRRLYRAMHDAACEWDGGDPVRSLPALAASLS